jgi:enediyne biosynthesis protein E7
MSYSEALPHPGLSSGPVNKIPVGRMMLGVKRTPLHFMRDLYAQPPGLHVSQFLGRKYVVASDLKAIRHVLTDNVSNYRKTFGAYKEALGRSSLVAHGEEWRRVRTVNQRAFHAKRLPSLLDSNRPLILRFVESLHAAARSGQPVDLPRALGGLMLALTCNAMFARHLPRSESEVFEDVDLFVRVMDRRSVSFTPVGRMLAQFFVSRFGPAVRRWRELPNRIRAAPQTRDPEGTLLALLMDRFQGQQDSDGGNRIVDEEMLLFLAAGSQTSAATLTFALFLLSRHLDVLNRAREQLSATGIDSVPGAAELGRLPVFEQIMSEAMRLYPPVWAVTRVALADDELSGCRLRRGDMVIISYYGLHRSPRYWANADDFNPGRFFAGSDANRPAYVYLPFGAGPRACVGMQLATMQAISILAPLIGQLDFTFQHPSAELTDKDLRAGISLWPKRPMMVALARRR